LVADQIKKFKHGKAPLKALL